MTTPAAAGLEPTETELSDVHDILTIPGPITSAAEVRARGFSVNRAYLGFLRDAHDEGDRERVSQMLRLMTAVERVVDDLSPAPRGTDGTT